MTPLKAQFDEKADRCLALAKAIARGENTLRLDPVHVVHAAATAFPEDVASYCRAARLPWSDGIWALITPLAVFGREADRMPVTRHLAVAVRRLGSGGRTITLSALVQDLLRAPSVRLEALLHRLGGTTGGKGRRRETGGAQPYHSRRDWLADERRLWHLRRAAARAHDLSAGQPGYEGEGKPYSADGALSAADAAASLVAQRAKVSPAKADPLRTVPGDMNPVERHLCSGMLVHELFGLDPYSGFGPTVGNLAQMLKPEVYPANCQEVLLAVDELLKQGIVIQREDEEAVRLGARVRLAPHVMEAILTDLATDAISAGEAKALKRAVCREEVWYAGNRQ